MRAWWMGLLAAALSAGLAAADTPTPGPKVAGLIAEMDQAKQAKAWTDALAAADALLALNPQQPTLRAARARVLALAGREADAVVELRWLAVRGWGLDARAMRDLGPMLAKSEHQAIAARLAALQQPRGAAHQALLLADVDFTSEGVDYDPIAEVFYLSTSVGGLVRTDLKGRMQTLYREPRLARQAAGVRLDRRGGRIFMCSSPAGEGAERAGSAELLVFSMDGGAPLAQIPLGPHGTGHYCNDITLLPDGRVLVTDSPAGRVWVHDGGQTMTPFTPELFAFPNGVAVAADAGRVYVADFLGLWALDLSGRVLGRIAGPGGEHLGGIDGLYVQGRRLLGVQNIVSPPRVIAIRPGEGRAGCVKVLAAAQASLVGMTTAAVLGERLAVVNQPQTASGERPAITMVPAPKSACG
jgi:hypothetical protein